MIHKVRAVFQRPPRGLVDIDLRRERMCVTTPQNRSISKATRQMLENSSQAQPCPSLTFRNSLLVLNPETKIGSLFSRILPRYWAFHQEQARKPSNLPQRVAGSLVSTHFDRVRMKSSVNFQCNDIDVTVLTAMLRSSGGQRGLHGVGPCCQRSLTVPRASHNVQPPEPRLSYVRYVEQDLLR